MSKYRIIGNMTGNSMDALDFILTEFDEDKITDICAYSKPYDNIMQKDIDKSQVLLENINKYVFVLFKAAAAAYGGEKKWLIKF